MLTRLKNLFSGPQAWPVETFGKLPCYQDYISLVTTKASVHWRDWLLAQFRGDTVPPEGLWPFVFQHQKNGMLVVGLIQASSDGLREFPFSLFVACDTKMVSSPAGLTAIWGELKALHWQLLAAPDIQGVYGCCAGRKVSLDPEQSGGSGAQGQKALLHQPGSWPRLLIAGPGNAATLHLVWQGGMPQEEFERNWQGLRPQQP
jgi:hypothetical protein